MGTQDFTQAAKDAAKQSGDALNHNGGELADAAKDFAVGARDKIMDEAQRQMQGQKKAGADYLDGLAGTLDRVAGELDREMPFAGDLLRGAGRQAEAFADSIRKGDVSDLVRNAQDFARANPTIAFGVAMLAGFGLMRLVKSGAAPAEGADA